jgi:hypothetical protein
MTTFLIVLLAVVLAFGGLASFSLAMARRIEKAVPPQGGFLDLDGERLAAPRRSGRASSWRPLDLGALSLEPRL